MTDHDTVPSLRTDNGRTSGPEVYAPVLIHLLSGPVYSEDRVVWDLLLRYQNAVQSYFDRMGLELYINEADGFAYLSQPDIEDDDGATISLPRLTRRRALTFQVTVLLVILREQLNQFDTTNLEGGRLIIPAKNLFQLVYPFYREQGDERTRFALIERDINHVVALGFLKEIRQDNEKSYLVRPILKAKLNSDDLAQIKAELMTYAKRDHE